ncbi:MAG: hypothetical protein ACXVHS_00015 [Methanobacterium sp.]
MDIFIILGAILLAYGGIILIYLKMRAKERRVKVSNLLHKATLSMRRGNKERALIYFNSAYEYSINGDNKADAAEALYNMGYIYNEEGKIDVAIEYWNHANDLFDEINDKQGNKKIKEALKSINDKFQVNI